MRDAPRDFNYAGIQYLMKNKDFMTIKPEQSRRENLGEDRWMVEAFLICFMSYALNIILRYLSFKDHSI